MIQFKSYPQIQPTNPINFAGYFELQSKKLYAERQQQIIKQQFLKLVKGV